MADQINQIIKKLSEFTPDNMEEKLPLLYSLLDKHYKAKVQVDAERAKLMTEYMIKTEGKNIPMQIRRAASISNYLSNRQIRFHDENLLGGSTTLKELGAPVYPEFSLSVCIWPELDTISNRKANPQILSKEEAEILNNLVFPYWMDRNILERVRLIDPVRQSLGEKIVIYLLSKQGTISHVTPFYEVVLKKGIKEIINEAKEKENKTDDKDKKIFYQSVQIAMQGVINYAKNISAQAKKLSGIIKDLKLKKRLLEISEVCSKVPENKANTFREAVNSLWICQTAVLAENSNMAINPGRLDQILYPYFIKDYKEKKLTIEEALNITGCLWLKLADNVNVVPESAEKLWGGAGAVPAVTLGGVDKNGDDAVNELTYLLLKTTELIPIRDPNINARFYPGINPVQYKEEVSRVILSTKAIPAFHNDIENIKTLVNQGLTLEHARDYTIVGCVELGSAGRDYTSSSSIFIMMYTCLYMTLHNGKTPVTGDKQIGPKTGDAGTFKTFGDFWNAYKKQMEWMVDNTVSLNNTYGMEYQKYMHTPILSAFFEGPLDKGKDLIHGGAIYNSSGVTHIAFADVCDSINAIDDICFNKKSGFKMKLNDFVEAVDCNYFDKKNAAKQKKYDLLLSYLKNKAPKYGTSNPIARKNSGNMIKLQYELFNKQKNYRNGNYRVSYWTMTNHAGYGSVSQALPSGRKAHVVFSSGITPVSQVKTDLTTVLKSVAGLDSKCIPGSYALNIKYAPVEITKQTIKKFSDVVEGYFKSGGQQVQFNIHDYHTLQEAQRDPESHPHLLVRVSGYSAYFKSLNKYMQDELITRSQYNLTNAKLIELKPLPKSFVDPD